jgi:hypothetical protein
MIFNNTKTLESTQQKIFIRTKEEVTLSFIRKFYKQVFNDKISNDKYVESKLCEKHISK